MSLTYAIMGMAAANDYSKTLSDRVRRSVNIRVGKCQQGVKLNLGHWRPRWIDFKEVSPNQYSFVFNNHAATIQRIVREYIKGYSMIDVAKRLLRDNIPTLKGGQWAQGTVGHILNTGSLTGDITINKTTLKGYYPAVITPTEYKQLQAKLRENRNRKGGTANTDNIVNLFRNRCKCGHCGGSVCSMKNPYDKTHFYICRNRSLHKCPSKSTLCISAVELDFFKTFLNKEPNDFLLTQTTPEHSNRVITIQAEIAQYDKDISQATELLGSIPIDELKVKLATLENRRQTAKGELDKLNTSIISSQNIPRALNDIRAEFLRWSNARGDYLKTMLANAFDFNLITKPLKDNTTRKRLLGLLPSIVKELVIDTTKKRYAVVGHNGSRSEWRSIEKVK